jgi:SulP family sulfate permease
MNPRYRFNRLEFAGSLGDLGTLLPLAIGLIMINGLSPAGIFLSVGLFYIFSGIYYSITVPVQPMKVIGAYAIATTMSAAQITASGFLMGLVFLVLGASGAMTVIGKYVPKSVIRGVQLSTGTLLMVQGVKFMLGSATLQSLHYAAEPYLRLQSIGSLPIGIIIGIAGGLLTLLLLDNPRFPAGLLVVLAGLITGSNLIIGGIFVLLAVLLGNRSLSVIYLLPLSVLGILLLFAGSQLSLTIMDLKNRKDFFVTLVIMGITLATNLAAGFVAGIAVAYLLRWEKLNV